MTPQINHVYRVNATQHTNEIAEELQMNICNRRALVVHKWFGRLMCRINTGRGVWSQPVELEAEDLRGE